MKTWQRYVFIHIPIGIFCCIINFCAKNDDRPPYAKYHLLHEFEKDEYSVKDLVTGSNLGELILHKNDDMLYFDIVGDGSGETDGHDIRKIIAMKKSGLMTDLEKDTEKGL